MARLETPKFDRLKRPDPAIWTPIHGMDGAYEVARELGVDLKRSYFRRVMADLIEPDGDTGNGSWWWRGRIVEALEADGRVPS